MDQKSETATVGIAWVHCPQRSVSLSISTIARLRSAIPHELLRMLPIHFLIVHYELQSQFLKDPVQATMQATRTRKYTSTSQTLSPPCQPLCPIIWSKSRSHRAPQHPRTSNAQDYSNDRLNLKSMLDFLCAAKTNRVNSSALKSISDKTRPYKQHPKSRLPNLTP